MKNLPSSLKTYCIIGDPINHSLSPGMQNAAFSSLNLNCTYIALRVPAGELPEAIGSIRASGISGFNVTIPHKIEVMKLLDELDGSAIEASAVNTVNNVDGRLIGYNTDIDGFIEPLRRRQVLSSGQNVLLIGAGGAARAVIAAVLRERIASSITIANRDVGKAEALAEITRRRGIKCSSVQLEEAKAISPQSDLIVNASAIGLHNEPSPLGQNDIRKGTIVYDIIYRPVITGLIANAKRAQAIIVYGYEMLVEQGAKAFEIWTGLSAPRESMKKNLIGIFGEPV